MAGSACGPDPSASRAVVATRPRVAGRPHHCRGGARRRRHGDLCQPHGARPLRLAVRRPRRLRRPHPALRRARARRRRPGAQAGAPHRVVDRRADHARERHQPGRDADLVDPARPTEADGRRAGADRGDRRVDRPVRAGPAARHPPASARRGDQRAARRRRRRGCLGHRHRPHDEGRRCDGRLPVAPGRRRDARADGTARRPGGDGEPLGDVPGGQQRAHGRERAHRPAGAGASRRRRRALPLPGRLRRGHRFDPVPPARGGRRPGPGRRVPVLPGTSCAQRGREPLPPAAGRHLRDDPRPGRRAARGSRPGGQADVPGRGECQAVERPGLRGDADRGRRGRRPVVRGLVRDLAWRRTASCGPSPWRTPTPSGSRWCGSCRSATPPTPAPTRVATACCAPV